MIFQKLMPQFNKLYLNLSILTGLNFVADDYILSGRDNSLKSGNLFGQTAKNEKNQPDSYYPSQ
jgi:hypothetical protein